MESWIACGSTENLAAFPHPRVAALDATPARARVERARRRLGPRPLGPVDAVVRACGATVLHSHFGHVGWFDSGVVRRRGLRHVVSFYGLDVARLPQEDPRWRARYREMFAGASAVLCEGPRMAADVAALGCDPERVVVHPLGVDLEALPAFRPRSWDGSRPLRVLLAGSFREKKGLPDAMDALGALVRAGVPLTATLIGDAAPGDDAEKGRILDAIRRNDLDRRVRLLGFQPHGVLLEEAEGHDVFLSPSVTAADGDCEGGAPVAIIEMAAIGMPILSTLHCDIPTVVAEPNRRLLVPERDPAALADACVRLADADWTAIAQANRALVEADFSCGVQGERLARIYFPEG